VQRATGQIVSFVFHRDGRVIRDFRRVWAEACKAACVPGVSCMIFAGRRSGSWSGRGVPRSVAMKLTGHKTENVYRRYAFVSDADLSEGVAKLAALGSHADGARVMTLRQNGQSR
jgi:hypothetical protein